MSKDTQQRTKQLREELLNLQKDLWPQMFMAFPPTGICHSCQNDLIMNTPVVKLTAGPLTGCPRCNRSFVE